MKAKAHLGQLGREGGGVRPVLFATLNRVVRDEPGVAAAPNARRRGAPASDVRLVLVLHADRLPIERGLTPLGEVKHELMTVVEKAPAVDGFVMTDGEVFVEPSTSAGKRLLDRDRLD